MTEKTAIKCSRIFDGETLHEHSAILIQGGLVEAIVPGNQVPEGYSVECHEGELLTPGFIDLQVNGGGGLLFNEKPEVETIRTMCEAHVQFGSTSLMPTLITDDRQTTQRAIEAAINAQREGVPGFLGLHLEGPHLSQARNGAHEPSFIRKMEDDDLDLLLKAASELSYLMITLAPESVDLEQISKLSSAGIIVSIGHSNGTFDQIQSCIDAGASCITHLFNAMSPLTHREPGMVGAALQNNHVFAGLIADGHHVHEAAIDIALRAKNGPGKIFLVTDSMSTIGTDIKSFELNGRKILRENGCLRLEDGTLAGADLDMAAAVDNICRFTDLEIEEAIRMATVYPALCMGATDKLGYLKPGAFADMNLLDKGNRICRVWRKGVPSIQKAEHDKDEDH